MSAASISGDFILILQITEIDHSSQNIKITINLEIYDRKYKTAGTTEEIVASEK